MPGHVRKRGRGWVYVVELPALNGKRKQDWSRQFPTEKDASTALSKRLVELGEGIGTNPSRETLAAYLPGWLEARRDIKEHTRYGYGQDIAQYIVPELGHIRITQLTPAQIEAWHRSLLSRPLAPATVVRAHAILRRALTHAVRHGLVSRNVCSLVSPPRIERRTVVCWDRAEAKAFYNACDDSQYGVLLKLLLATGLRIGEALALTWNDVDLLRGTLTVRRTLTDNAQGKREIGTTAKTPASQRSIELDTAIMGMLSEYKRSSVGVLLFQRDDGSPLWAETARVRMNEVVTRAGVPPLTLHGLRHTHATLLLAGGASMHYVSRRLGHASYAVTADIYGHVIPEMGQQATGILDQVWG